VAGFDGKMTMISGFADGRRSSLSEEITETIEVLGNKSDSIKAVVVSLDDNVLEIMDPETYKIILAARPKDFEIKPGAEVNVVRTANGFIVLE
jgi:nonsense-mediated mRNA decay protein 3